MNHGAKRKVRRELPEPFYGQILRLIEFKPQSPHTVSGVGPKNAERT